MANENKTRLIILIIVGAVHAALIFFFAFNINTVSMQPKENARVMLLTDFAEIQPAPPPPPPPPVRREPNPAEVEVEAIAEVIIETDVAPLETIVAPGTLISPSVVTVQGEPGLSDYLAAHQVASSPFFDEREIMSMIVYPQIALRAGIEGQVILELFVDREGTVREVRVLREVPENRGFAEAAINVFLGRRGTPALDAEGRPVFSRFRYPVRFTIR